MNSEVNDRSPLKVDFIELPKQSRREASSKSCPPAIFNMKVQSVRLKKTEEGFDNSVWKAKSMGILVIVMRFITLITSQAFSQKFTLLTKRMFIMIGDQASDFSFYLMRDYFKYYKAEGFRRLQYNFQNDYIQRIEKYRILKYLLSKNYTFQPESYFLLMWNFYILVMLNFAIFYISAKFAFKLDYRPSQYHDFRKTLFYDTPFFSFICDIFLRFHICYYEKGHLITERKKIFKNYLQTSFGVDILVIISQIMYLYGGIINFDLFILIKVVQIPQLCGSLLDKLELTSQHLALYDLLRLCYLIVMEAHFCSCGWFYIGSLDTSNTWIQQQNLDGKDWIEQYFHTFYWSIITMSTIGYGDIVPQNLRERVFLIFIALFSCCTFGYSIGSIGQIFGQLSAKSNQIRIDMNSLKKYLRVKGFSWELQIKIRRYFEYVWNDTQDEQTFNISKFQTQLPQSIQNEMVIDINMRSLQKIPFLRDNFNDQFLQQLAAKFQEERYGALHNIYQMGQASDYVYILCEGSIEYFIEVPSGSQKIVIVNEQKEKDTIFGHISFLLDRSHSLNCRSTTSTRVIKISRVDFQEIAEKNGYEQYCQLKDKLKFSGRMDILNIRCQGCSKSSHTLEKCPMVTGFPNKSKILLSYRKHYPNERIYFKRKNQFRRINALKSEDDISDSVICYLLNDQKNLKQISNEYQVETIKNNSLRRLMPVIDKGRNSINVSNCGRNSLINNIQGGQSISDSVIVDDIKPIRKKSKFNFKTTKFMLDPRIAQIKRNDSLQQYISSKEIIHKQQPIMDEISEGEELQLQIDIAKTLNFKHINQDTSNNNTQKDIVLLNSSQESGEHIGQIVNTEKSSSQTLSNGIALMQNIELNEIGLSMGIHKDIFENFDKLQDFEYYMPNMNLKSILQESEEINEMNQFQTFLQANMINKKRMKQSKYLYEPY